MSWTAQRGSTWKSTEAETDWDDCDVAWRPLHECGRLLATKFIREQDCQRAVRILNKEFPCDGMAAEEVQAAIKDKYVSHKHLCDYVTANSCAW